MKRLEYLILPGMYAEKKKGKQPGLNINKVIREELRFNGYPTVECTEVCDQPDICDLIDCGVGGSNTYTNGITKTGDDVELGGALDHATTLTAPGLLTFDLVKDNVKLAVSPSTFGAYGIGESIYFRGVGPDVNASSGIYTNALGNPSFGVHVFDTPTNVFMRTNFSTPLQAIKTDVGVDGSGITNELFISLDKSSLGHFDQGTNTYTSFSVETVTLPVAGLALFMRNVPLFANDAAAALVLPKDAIWRDASNNLKIVP